MSKGRPQQHAQHMKEKTLDFEFFREAILRICDTLELVRGLEESFWYLRERLEEDTRYLQEQLNEGSADGAVAWGAETESQRQPRSQRLEDVMRAHIQEVLHTAEGKVEGPGGAAEILDMHPSTLRKRMRKLKIPFGRKAFAKGDVARDHRAKRDAAKRDAAKRQDADKKAVKRKKGSKKKASKEKERRPTKPEPRVPPSPRPRWADRPRSSGIDFID